jgi:hypothetical protein
LKRAIKHLIGRVEKLAAQTDPKPPYFPICEPEGKAWQMWCLSHLTDEERRELEFIIEQYNASNRNAPHWKDPACEAWDQERMRILHRFGELEKVGESRALLEPRDAWPRFLVEARQELTQLEKVKAN